jgi:hypothetical protein
MNAPPIKAESRVNMIAHCTLLKGEHQCKRPIGFVLVGRFVKEEEPMQGKHILVDSMVHSLTMTCHFAYKTPTAPTAPYRHRPAGALMVVRRLLSRIRQVKDNGGVAANLKTYREHCGTK